MARNKELFLENLAFRLGRPRIMKPVAKPQWQHHPQDKVLQGATQDELVQELASRCAGGHTGFSIVAKKDLAQEIKRILKVLEANSVVASNDRRNEEYGLTQLYKDLKNKIDMHEWYPEYGRKNVEFAEKAKVGITFADLALAESGTVVLFTNEQMGRSISLLPHAHIAIIAKSAIVPRMTQATHVIRERFKETGEVPSCVNFISGPSKSADIEMKLVVGVHGPVEVFYIVVEDM